MKGVNIRFKLFELRKLLSRSLFFVRTPDYLVSLDVLAFQPKQSHL